MKDYWTTSDGRQIKYKDLTDDHLKNLIKDGYRNTLIEEEANKSGFEVPELEIDKLSDKEILIWVESSASNAISGNRFAEIMIGYWRTNPQSFFFHLNQLLTRRKELNNIESDKEKIIEDVVE